MRAVMIAGGRGTRLQPYTAVLPKPLVPVGERPILELIIRQLAQCGFTDIDLCIGHLGELIRAYITEGTSLPQAVSIRYHHEKEALGTAGALRYLHGIEESFLVMNGDILTTLDYGELVRFHRESGRILTVATFQKDVEIELGVIEHGDGFISDYVEKPTMHFMVSMGIYVYEPAILSWIPDHRYDFPELVKALIEADERVAIYPFTGKWFDIGTTGEHAQAVAELSANPDVFERFA